MDSGAVSYRRFLAGDDNGITKIIRDYKDGLILYFYLDEAVTNTFWKPSAKATTMIAVSPLRTNCSPIWKKSSNPFHR